MKNKSIDLNLFHIKIKFFKNFISNNEIKNLLSQIKNNEHCKHGSLEGEAVSSFNLLMNFLKNSIIKNKLIKLIKEYSEDLGISNQIILNSWTNIQKKGSQLNTHNHNYAPISGVVYLKVDKDSSKIYFHNPNPYVYLMDIKKYNENNFWYVNFKPEIGDLFLFPGWLMHGSNNDINYSEERIVLSFNTINEDLFNNIKNEIKI